MQRNGSSKSTFDIDDGWNFIEQQAGDQSGREKRVAHRKAIEKPHVPKTDGRRLRRTGRETQMNLKVREPVRNEFRAIAKAEGMSMGELLEQMLEAWKGPREGSS